MSARKALSSDRNRMLGAKKSSFPSFGAEISDSEKVGFGNENSISPMKKGNKSKNSNSVLGSAAPKSRASVATNASLAPPLKAHQTSDLLKHYYSDDDEFDQFTSQRIDVKESSELLILNSPERIQYTSPARKTVQSSDDNVNNATKKTHYVTIIDYEFDYQTLTINYGDSVEFRLSVDVPLHAEHQLQGISPDSNLLNFESPLLQQEECTSYVYTPKDVGTLKVQCNIYPDMICNITVKNRSVADVLLINSPQRVGKSKSSENNLDNEAISYNVSISQTYFDCYKRLIEHVAGDIVDNRSALVSVTLPDSHTGVGEKDYLGSMGCTSSHCGTSVCDSDDSASIAGDTATNTPVRDRKVVKERSKEIINETKTATKRVVGDVVPVIVRDFEFHPKELDIVCGTRVKFIFECNSSQKLCCEGQFEGISMDTHPSKKCNDGTYSHDFWDGGTHLVSNEVFSFMLCTIRVKKLPSPESTPKLVKKREIKKLDDITEIYAVVTKLNDAKDNAPNSQDSIDAISSEDGLLSEADLRRKLRNKKKREKKRLNKELKILTATGGGNAGVGNDIMKEEQGFVEKVNECFQETFTTDSDTISKSADSMLTSEVTDSACVVLEASEFKAVDRHEEIAADSSSACAESVSNDSIPFGENQVDSIKKSKKKSKKKKQVVIPTLCNSPPVNTELTQDIRISAEDPHTNIASNDVKETDKIAQYYKDIEAFMCNRMSILHEAYHGQGYELTASAKRAPIVLYKSFVVITDPVTPGETPAIDGSRNRRSYRRQKASKR